VGLISVSNHPRFYSFTCDDQFSADYFMFLHISLRKRKTIMRDDVAMKIF
jgi:hypothetical protein